MKEQLQLSEGEAQLLRGLSFARMVVLKAGDPHSVEDLPLHNTPMSIPPAWRSMCLISIGLRPLEIKRLFSDSPRFNKEKLPMPAADTMTG